jgi:hypothetical protein
MRQYTADDAAMWLIAPWHVCRSSSFWEGDVTGVTFQNAFLGPAITFKDEQAMTLDAIELSTNIGKREFRTKAPYCITSEK